MTDPTIFIVDPSAEARDRLAIGLPDDEEWIGHDSLAQLAQSIDAGLIPAVAIVGPGVVHDDSIMLAESVNAERMPVAIIQIVKTLDPDRLRDALRAGITDVVEDDAEPTELAGAIRRACHHATELAPEVSTIVTTSPPPPTNRKQHVPVIAVSGAKGGVGTSLVAGNLAAAFGRQGLTAGVIDLDVTGGDQAIMLQRRPSLTVLDAVGRVDHLDLNAIDGYLTPATGGVRLLAAPLEGADETIDSAAFTRVVDLVAQLCDVIVIDVGDIHRAVSRQVLGDADRVIAVTTLEVPSVRATKQLLSLLASRNVPPKRIILTVNQSDAPTGMGTGDIEKTLETAVSAKIPVDKLAARSVNEGDPLVNRRRSKAGGAITKMAEALATQLIVTT